MNEMEVSAGQQEQEAWGTEAPQAPDEVTMAKMEELSERGFQIRQEIKELGDREKELQDELRGVKAKILSTLTHFGLTKYASKNGSVFTKKTYSVRVPKDDESRERFFGFLKAEGIFDNLITVNSRTLNSLYNERLEAAKDAGESFNMPGIEPPTMFEDVNFKK